MARFHHYTALSNWLRGHDRYRGTFSKALIPESTYRDAFYVLGEEDDHRQGLLKAQRLVAKLGIAGDRVIKLSTELPTESNAEDAPFAQRNDVTGTGIGWRWPRPEIPLAHVALLSDDGHVSPIHVEDAYALAYKLDARSLLRFGDLVPRSFSVLPIARACQASCAFCFSKASVSDLVAEVPPDFVHIAHVARMAARAGAKRAVITGGGEPGLLRQDQLLRLIAILAGALGRVTLITNGWHLSKRTPEALDETLAEYQAAGLSVLSLSRHGIDAERNARIMGIDADAHAIFRGAARSAPAVRRRLVCVLQTGGVENAETLASYLSEAVRIGAQEICFKELYVASREESLFATRRENDYCKRHRVPLDVLVHALERMGFARFDALPWGSPIFRGEWDGTPLTVAAYTEPSVGWERVHGIARSWNALADGRVLASLEDDASEIAVPLGPQTTRAVVKLPIAETRSTR